jgi:hypothetical protein
MMVPLHSKNRIASALQRPSSGAVEAMKLVGFAAMVCDHANKIDFNDMIAWPTVIGRLAFPLFAFILAVNLRRHSHDRQRYFTRLILWGMVAQPIYHWAAGRNDLNILFTLAIGLQLVLAVEELGATPLAGRLGAWARLVVTLGASLAADYQLLGPLLILVLHSWLDDPRLELSVLSLLLLGALNLDPQFILPALAAVPLALVLSLWRPPVRRAGGWLFYLLYPGHLAVLRLLAQSSSAFLSSMR